MIRVLHIIKSLGRGGAEMLLPETLKLHDQQAFEFHYIYFLPWKSQMVSSIKEAGGEVTCMPAKNNLSVLLRSNKVKTYIRQHQISLIHCHLPWTGFMGRYLYRVEGVPVIYTEHNKQERYHPITRFLNRITFNEQAQVIAVSSDVKKSIQKNIRPKVKVSTILNGVNTQSFVKDLDAAKAIRKQLKIADSTVVIGTIAVFRSQKRLKEWIQVFKKVHEKHPDTHAVIVGDGLLRKEIEAEIAELNLQSCLSLAGLQPNVKPWLSAMDIFLMSSVFEGLPIALLEAMSMQCAIVTTDAGGIKEVIRNGQDGLMVSVDSWKELSHCVDQLLHDPLLIKKYGESARKRAEESFSLVEMVYQLENLYTNLAHVN